MPSFSAASRRFGCSVLAYARGVAIGTLIVLAVSFCCLSPAEARVGESLVAFGDEMARLMNARLGSTVGHFSINGLEFRRATVATSLSVSDVLDRLEGSCQARGGIENPAAVLETPHPARDTALPGILYGMYRHESIREGVLTCVDTGGPIGVAEVSRRLQQFVKTGDLAVVGKLRYALVRRDGTLTSALVMWTDGSAPLMKMFPKTGDAPGKEPLDIPRPPGSQRLLAAEELGTSYGIAVYRCLGFSPDALRDWYISNLTDRGWRLTKSVYPNTVVGQRGNRTILVRVATAASGQITSSVTELS